MEEQLFLTEDEFCLKKSLIRKQENRSILAGILMLLRIITGKKHPQIRLPLTKSMSMDILALGASNQLLNLNKFFKKMK